MLKLLHSQGTVSLRGSDVSLFPPQPPLRSTTARLTPIGGRLHTQGEPHSKQNFCEKEGRGRILYAVVVLTEPLPFNCEDSCVLQRRRGSSNRVTLAPCTDQVKEEKANNHRERNTEYLTEERHESIDQTREETNRGRKERKQ